MELSEFLNHLDRGKTVVGGSEIHKYMSELSREAMKITAQINNAYHTPEELRELFEKLIGQPECEGFRMFPPFYTDCGKNIHVGKTCL